MIVPSNHFVWFESALLQATIGPFLEWPLHIPVVLKGIQTQIPCYFHPYHEPLWPFGYWNIRQNENTVVDPSRRDSSFPQRCDSHFRAIRQESDRPTSFLQRYEPGPFWILGQQEEEVRVARVDSSWSRQLAVGVTLLW